MYFAHDASISKQIIRIKRINTGAIYWKTLVFVEIECSDEKEVRTEVKNVINEIALLKQYLLGTENVDLYLFLAFSNYSNSEECLRIESTEGICRKYVLMPDEDMENFFKRTFLHKVLEDNSKIDGQDPIERAFNSINKDKVLLDEESQKKWMDHFLKYSGSELAEKLICED